MAKSSAKPALDIIAKVNPKITPKIQFLFTAELEEAKSAAAGLLTADLTDLVSRNSAILSGDVASDNAIAVMTGEDPAKPYPFVLVEFNHPAGSLVNEISFDLFPIANGAVNGVAPNAFNKLFKHFAPLSLIICCSGSPERVISPEVGSSRPPKTTIAVTTIPATERIVNGWVKFIIFWFNSGNTERMITEGITALVATGGALAMTPDTKAWSFEALIKALRYP
ncbi:MAG: hypothetical protein KKD79_03665, partial [Candidatus Omnitrophica bacterium]|nr:hypothetical protein [Candidatus Omnitrophota bacterium]